jgi:hypothetical protein
VPEAIANLSAQQRLEQILRQGLLRGFPPFGADTPAICMSEARDDHLIDLIGRGNEPWGLVFSRQWVVDQGGGPVWPVRTHEWGGLTREQKAWAVRFEPGPDGRSDWLHEQEWRLLLDHESPFLEIQPANLEAILVGDGNWQRDIDWYQTVDGGIASSHEVVTDPYLTFSSRPIDPFSSVPLWYWNSATGTIDRIGLESG